MKIINVVFAAFVFLSFNSVLSAQEVEDGEITQIAEANKVQVFYFHFTRRCATCNAVEEVSKEAITEFYGDKVVFTGFNLDETIGEAKGKELDVSGQTLLIIAGNEKINITNEAFMNARNNPEKLKQVIKEKIDPVL